MSESTPTANHEPPAPMEVVLDGSKIVWNDYSDHPAFNKMAEQSHFDEIIANEKAERERFPLTTNATDVRNAQIKSWETVSKLVLNDAGDFFRESLLPRSLTGGSWLIDNVKDIDGECGYPRWITPWQYRYMYDREGVAKRVNDLPVDECWAIYPDVYETEDNKVDTDFEEDFARVNEELNLLSMCKRADKQSRIAYFGIAFYGVQDGELDLRQPVRGLDPRTGEILDKKNPPKWDVPYIRVFDETQVRILSFESDPLNPRYSQPYLYYIRFIDVIKGEQGGAIAGIITKHVHWTRVRHLCDGRGSSETFGTPSCQEVYNRLYDIRKILSASGEMYWKGGLPGYSFEINPEVAAEADFDEEATRDEFERYSNGLQRYLALKGLTVKSLAPQVKSPKDHFETQIRAICIAKGFPLRVFMGTEQQQRTDSTEEVKNWKQWLASRQEDYITPYLLRPIIKDLIRFGTIRPPKVTKTNPTGRFIIEWKDLNTVSDKDKADLSFKRTQALAQYMNGFVYKFIGFELFLIHIMFFTQDEAAEIIKDAGGEDAIRKACDEHMSMQANSLDGGVQVKSSKTAGDTAKAKGKTSKGGTVAKKK